MQGEHRSLLPLHTCMLLFCCMVLFMTGCSGSSITQLPPGVGNHSASPKTGANGSPGEAQLRKVQSIMQGMSLDQKLGQLILVEYLGHDYQASGLQQMVSQQYVGGFIYQQSNSNFNVPDDQIDAVNAFSVQAQKDARIPLLITTDQEGGLVNRLATFHGDLPSAQDMANSGNPQMAYDQGTQAAKWMLQLGMNADLAPVVDVQTVSPPVLESRMFGSDPQTVITYAGAYLKGLQQNNVIGTLKHFPGLGAITSDPHDGLPEVDRSMADLNKIDLAPYKTMIPQDQPAMIMATDVLMPAIDPKLPAELSPKAINGVLRGQLGYNGVVISDALYMGGITAQWTLSQAVVLAIIAGDDLVEGPYTPDQVAGVVTALKQAISSGQLSTSRIDQSVQRILLMKMKYGLIK
jgi:beta-N-acetylhexosaminidase